ncbi:N-acetylmuramoyl-L-alanine amidase [Staphylococcus canis]|uniref:SH3 domain-containing protein n=1 Tax=Staphylococcus canis TaxID=2724942 RepID=A0ABS0T5Z6_9STAP|nr:N-acetylmuramoyl-L-alanine amidase [Staphylococcus canis]MBI5974171.1 SH3 domain-containing protein [Staphylococcus canis]
MSQFEKWLKSKNIKTTQFYFILLILAILMAVLISFLLLNHKDEKKLQLTENAEIRTGPNAGYPEIYKVHKGDIFNIVSKEGKWIEVIDQSETKKGWIAGWHTSLNIKPDVDPNADPLRGKTIVLDPGHGGGDQGASGQTPKKTLEKNITLKTALELKNRLESKGAKVKMTRDDDTYVKLKDRKADGDVFISIHNDALESNNANGATVYWYHEQQERLADVLNASIQKKALLSNRGSRQENYQVLRQTKLPAVLLELGYISNPTDEVMMRDKNYRAIVEEAIVDGLETYFLS